MKNKMYSTKYFHNSLPDWKRKIDSKPVRYFYRPASFVLSSICANIGITANTVSYLSAITGILGCLCYLLDNYMLHIIGAALINLWLVMDCTDGNLARCVKRQVFGEFADAVSSYLLVGFMCTCIGFAAYFEDGLFLQAGCPWIILIGAIASTSDALTRSVYHKFRITAREMTDKSIITGIKEEVKAKAQRGFLRALFEDQFGLGGFLPLFILLATIFHALDVITVYFMFYYGCGLFATLCITIKEAVVAAKKYEIR